MKGGIDSVQRMDPGVCPPAIIVDVDGTLALHNGRNPYDETLVSGDLPNPAVISVVRALHKFGQRVLVVSGRRESSRAETTLWLERHLGVPLEGLYMRQQKDTRRDVDVKREIYQELIAGRYSILCVLDDRQQVVDLWRSLGLTCFQVASGDF